MKTRLLLLTLCVLFSPSHVPAGDRLSFANVLLEEGEFYRAITEYKRYLHENPDGLLRHEAELGIGLAYLEGGETERAWDALDRLIAQAPESPQAGSARLSLAGSLYQHKRYVTPLHLSGDLPLPEEERRQFETLCRLRLNQPSPEPTPVEQDWFSLYRGLPRKNPALAGTLSAVLPGAGQLYARRPRDAFWAFTLNALFFSAAWYAFEHDEPVAGSLCGAFALIWYSGNIYNAIDGAHLTNNDREQSFFRPLEEQIRWSNF